MKQGCNKISHDESLSILSIFTQPLIYIDFKKIMDLFIPFSIQLSKAISIPPIFIKNDIFSLCDFFEQTQKIIKNQIVIDNNKNTQSK
ncbi:unnamed protein product [Paramecium pentaurelia]|uniref:Uncharacterized protein n=1 Tax=Paramecium pentaurelia TaxID=43138 RepID=A0A8S1VDR2_9CILI|nr:unnamed protein product [Paramecium pentaurelia]